MFHTLILLPQESPLDRWEWPTSPAAGAILRTWVETPCFASVADRGPPAVLQSTPVFPKVNARQDRVPKVFLSHNDCDQAHLASPALATPYKPRNTNLLLLVIGIEEWLPHNGILLQRPTQLHHCPAQRIQTSTNKTHPNKLRLRSNFCHGIRLMST
jgi:hypothetical protein